MKKDPEVIERLQRFSYRAKELADLRLVRSGMEMKFSIHVDHASQFLRYQMPKVDEEDLRSFLLTFRQFVSKGEPVFIDRVFNDCDRFLDDDMLKQQIRKARQAWSNLFRSTGPISMKINEIAGFCYTYSQSVPLNPNFITSQRGFPSPSDRN